MSKSRRQPPTAEMFILILYLGVCIKNHFPQVYLRGISPPSRLVLSKLLGHKICSAVSLKFACYQKLKCQGTVICQQILMIDKLFSFLSLVAFLLLGSGWQEEVIEMIVIANLWNKRYNSDSDGNRDSRLQDRESHRARGNALH